MLSQPPERTQTDGLQDLYSDASAIKDFGPSLTRQEFAQEADINYILGRFGIGDYKDRKPFYTETNYDIDLQTAITSSRAASAAWDKLPKEIREKYATWNNFARAVATGEYEAAQAEEDRQLAQEATKAAEYAAYLKTKGLTTEEQKTD